jgi:hypothetical protein
MRRHSRHESGAGVVTEPVFILGVAPRCGTNYVEDLLCVHPDCGLGIPLRENQLMDALPQLAGIVDQLGERWSKKVHWGFRPEHPADLARALGDGLIDFLVSQVDDRRRLHEPPGPLSGIEHAFRLSPAFLITKHPRANGLADFRRFFPDGKLILLMRDGRAVAESSIRSWGWDLDLAVDNWRQGASQMADFLESHPDDASILVRYEDLITDPEGEIDRIFDYIGLDPARFDFDRALRRPVRGSSTARPEGAESVDWQPVEKDDTFDPLARARGWTPAQHARFNHMAGDLSIRFGYPLEEGERGPASPIVNVARDAYLVARNLTRPLRRRISNGIG